MNSSSYDFQLFKIEQLAKNNSEKVKKMQKLIYILQNNIKLYKGKNGGTYYFTKTKRKVYI